MLKKKQLNQENTVFGVYVGEGLYSLAQSRQNTWMEFFNIFNSKDKWEHIDLNKIDILFTYSVASQHLGNLLCSIHNNITLNSRDIQRRIISTAGRKCPALIEMTDTYTSLDNEIIILELTTSDHLEKIYKYELAGMEGNPEKIRNRLLAFYETGINWDDSKKFVFPEVTQPESYLVPNYIGK